MTLMKDRNTQTLAATISINRYLRDKDIVKPSEKQPKIDPSNLNTMLFSKGFGSN